MLFSDRNQLLFTTESYLSNLRKYFAMTQIVTRSSRHSWVWWAPRVDTFGAHTRKMEDGSFYMEAVICITIGPNFQKQSTEAKHRLKLNCFINQEAFCCTKNRNLFAFNLFLDNFTILFSNSIKLLTTFANNLEDFSHFS